MADKFVERTILDELLRRLSKLSYPTANSIEESERPDFILTMPDGQIGIEVTRATHQEQIRMQKLKHSQLSDCFVGIQPRPDGSPARSNEELKKDMLLPDSEWKDAADVLSEWGEKIAAALILKRERCNQPGFRIFGRNWLLLFNEPGLSGTINDLEWATEFLRSVFADPYANPRDFDLVFVLSGHFLFTCKQGLVLSDYDEAGVRFSLAQ
jgi:hypothetical protein